MGRDYFRQNGFPIHAEIFIVLETWMILTFSSGAAGYFENLFLNYLMDCLGIGYKYHFSLG